jgi:hypothetical protein
MKTLILSGRRSGRTAARAMSAVREWNACYPEGTSVVVTFDDGSTKETRTRSAAQVLGGNQAVIWLDGVRGCYALERVQPAPARCEEG